MLAEINSCCPALMLAFLTFVTLFYVAGLDLHASLYPVAKPCQHGDDNQINKRNHGPNLEPFHVAGNDNLPGLRQFQNTNNGENRSILERNNELIDETRNHNLDPLWQDDLPHRFSKW